MCNAILFYIFFAIVSVVESYAYNKIGKNDKFDVNVAYYYSMIPIVNVFVTIGIFVSIVNVLFINLVRRK